MDSIAFLFLIVCLVVFNSPLNIEIDRLKKSVHDEDSREYKYSVLTPQSVLNSLDQFVIYKIKYLCASC